MADAAPELEQTPTSAPEDDGRFKGGSKGGYVPPSRRGNFEESKSRGYNSAPPQQAGSVREPMSGGGSYGGDRTCYNCGCVCGCC
eukprot:COSAG05_NODE_85_length_20698_cov_35.370309_9_plen_85_part_00